MAFIYQVQGNYEQAIKYYHRVSLFF
jgi:hypothetical protein